MARLKPKRISITQFTKRYSTETACKDYLAHARWPEGFVCPACGVTVKSPRTKKHPVTYHHGMPEIKILFCTR